MRMMPIKSTVTTLALLGAVASITLATPAAAEKFRFGLNGAPLSIEVAGAKEFARLVGEHSGGSMTIDVFEGDKLGKPVAQIENLQLGTQDFHGNVSDWLQKLEKDWSTLAMPFLFSGVDHVKKFQMTEDYTAMKERVAKEHGVRIVADNWYRLPKVLITTKPVFKPADLEGVKLRMPNLATYIDTWSSFGARPTVLAWSEAYLAMKTGTVEGMDTPITAVYPQKFYQAAPYVLKTDHLIAPYVVLVSEKIWQKMSADQQQVLLKAGAEAGDFYTDRAASDFKKHKQLMLAEGTVFVEADAKPFAAKAQDVMKKFEAEGKWSKGMVEKIRGLVN